MVNNNEQMTKNFLTVLVWLMSLFSLVEARPLTDLVHKEMNSHRLVFILFMLTSRSLLFYFCMKNVIDDHARERSLLSSTLVK